jgi:hypothetical protein
MSDRMSPMELTAEEMSPLTMVTDREGITESGVLVAAGTHVTYKGHVTGGMVRVELTGGNEEIMHPHCFAALRD